MGNERGPPSRDATGGSGRGGAPPRRGAPIRGAPVAQPARRVDRRTVASRDDGVPRSRNARPPRALRTGRRRPLRPARSRSTRLNAELMAHFASYALLETEWRDLKVACAALMLVQPHLRPADPRRRRRAWRCIDDDYREIGEAMVLRYQQKSTRTMNPKMVLRVAELLEIPEIAALNREAGFADPASRKPPLGRWPKAAREWLEHPRAQPEPAGRPRRSRLQGDDQGAGPQVGLPAGDRAVLRGARLERRSRPRAVTDASAWRG